MKAKDSEAAAAVQPPGLGLEKGTFIMLDSRPFYAPHSSSVPMN